MQTVCGALLIAALGFAPVAQGVSPARQAADDADVRAAVERFYAAQQAEDRDAYLALWSKRAQRPQPAQLKFIFDSGDDRFTEITIRRIIERGDRVRVRLSVNRERTIAGLPPGAGSVRMSAMEVGLTFVREDGVLKLWREGTPASDLAGALIDASSAAERDALLAAEPDLVGPGLLNAISQRASQAAQQMAYAEAETLFTLVIEVARRTKDRAAEGEALQNIANTFYFRGRYPEALRSYEERLAIERERKDDEAIASALLGIATVRYADAEYGVALDAYREALAIQERLPNAPALATTLISTGNILYLQGDYEGAIAEYRRSLAISRERDDRESETRAFEGLGRVLTAQGDFAAALEAFARVLEEAKARNDRTKQGMALQYVGEIQFKLGNFDEARTAYGASRAHYEAAKELANVGRVWQAIALTDLVAGRFELAEKEYTQSISICTAAADPECVPHATVGLAFSQSGQDKFVLALASYAKAIDAFTALGQREEAARARVGSAQAFAGKGDLDGALAAAVRARHDAIALKSEDVLWRALVMEARVLRRKEDPGALGAARAAVAVIERLQQRARERPGTQPPADGDSAFATLAVIQAAADDATAALATAEQMRLYRLRTTLAANEREIARGMTPEEREEEREAATHLASLGAQLARERALPRPDAARLARLEKAQAQAIATRAAQQQRLFARLPDLRVWRGLGPPASAADLDRVLAPAGVFLTFVADEEDLLTIVGVRGEAGVSLSGWVTRVSRRQIAERVAALIQTPTMQDADAWERAAREVIALLPARALAPLAAASSVLVVPDAGFWRVPFEALRFGERYLGDRATVAYSSSITAAIQTREAPVKEGAGLLAVAAPDVAAPLRERMLQTSPGWTLRSAESAEREVMTLKPGDSRDADSDVRLLLRADATEARVREHAPSAARLHIATPLRVNAASPMFSPLLMAGESDDAADDGLLEPREIINLDLAASMVVLSDGAALAMRDAARALDGLEWAWRSAGVEGVLLARWNTDQAAAETLLAAFHERVAAGEPAADALRAARATLRESDAARAPYQWAGWLLIVQQRRGGTPAPAPPRPGVEPAQQGDPGRNRARVPSPRGSSRRPRTAPR